MLQGETIYKENAIYFKSILTWTICQCTIYIKYLSFILVFIDAKLL
jgi:hypothetical protein